MNGEPREGQHATSAVEGACPAFEEAGHALFALVRLLGRPLAGHSPVAASGKPIELSRIMVVQAVEAAGVEDGPDAAIGVGTVAARLAIDPSTASRFVADTIADGFLTASAAPEDARRRHLALTAAGHDLAADARRFQGAIFAAATADWPEEAQHDFARHFTQFAANLAALRSQGAPANRD